MVRYRRRKRTGGNYSIKGITREQFRKMTRTKGFLQDMRQHIGKISPERWKYIQSQISKSSRPVQRSTQTAGMYRAQIRK